MSEIVMPMVEVSLDKPSAFDVQNDAITSGEGVNEAILESREMQSVAWPPMGPSFEDSPHLRFYSVGPNTYHIRCPLCLQRADTETVEMAGILGQLSCLMSTLSCCFPIFSLSFVYLCLQSRLKSKRLFCNKCGGHLGFYRRPS